MAKKAASGGGTPATEALTAAGIAFTLHAYDHDPRATSYGLEAAQALDVEPERVFKTLLVDVGSERTALAVGIVPVAGRLDLKALASALGVRKVVMADPAVASRVTGYVVGGISPIGQRTLLATVIDESAILYETILVSAGKRGLDLEVDPDDLARLLSASYADIAR